MWKHYLYSNSKTKRVNTLIIGVIKSLLLCLYEILKRKENGVLQAISSTMMFMSVQPVYSLTFRLRYQVISMPGKVLKFSEIV